MARIKIEVEDEVKAKLIKLGKESPTSLNRCLKHATTVLKGYVLDSETQVFGKPFRVKDGEFSVNATKFKKTGKTKFSLTVHPRFMVFEKGADIYTKNAPYLKFFSEKRGWITTSMVTIPKKPFFNRGLRNAIQADAVNKALSQSMQLEYKRLKINY